MKRNVNMPIKTRTFIQIAVMTLLSVVAVQAHSRLPESNWKLPPQPWTSGETIVTLKDGTLRISGNGAMEDYVWDGRNMRNAPPWEITRWRNASEITTVIIDEGVTYIGENAIRGTFAMKSITVAEGNAHYSSEDGVLFNKDKTVLVLYLYPSTNRPQDVYTIPNSVTTIGKKAFLYRADLTSITIPNSVTSIGDSAFVQCSNLTSITIPNSVMSIGKSAFERCSRLTSITIPSSLKNIKSRTFDTCDSLMSVTIENGVTTIESAAFYDCRNLTSVTIPKGVTYIGDGAFANCLNLSSVIFTCPRPPKFGSHVFSNSKTNFIYVPVRSYFAYRATGVFRGFSDVKLVICTYEIIVLSMLSTLMLSTTVFVIIKIIKKLQTTTRCS